jgi:hypothetical protein
MNITDFIDPLYALDAVAGAWVKMTYNTPIESIPIIGVKSSLNPLGRQIRKAYSLGEFAGQPKKGFFVNLAPMSPKDGPPLPKALDLKWPKPNTKES